MLLGSKRAAPLALRAAVDAVPETKKEQKQGRGVLKARPIGVGHAAPTISIPNKDMENIVETTDEWIQTRTGIGNRQSARGHTHTHIDTCVCMCGWMDGCTYVHACMHKRQTQARQTHMLAHRREDTNTHSLTHMYAHIGIENRHVLSGKETLRDLAIEAGKAAIKDAGIKAEDIDLVIVATSSPDDMFGDAPSVATGCGVSKSAFAFDLTAACSGFLFGTVTASQFLNNGGHKTALVVGADALTR